MKHLSAVATARQAPQQQYSTMQQPQDSRQSSDRQQQQMMPPPSIDTPPATQSTQAQHLAPFFGPVWLTQHSAVASHNCAAGPGVIGNSTRTQRLIRHAH